MYADSDDDIVFEGTIHDLSHAPEPPQQDRRGGLSPAPSRRSSLRSRLWSEDTSRSPTGRRASLTSSRPRLWSAESASNASSTSPVPIPRRENSRPRLFSADNAAGQPAQQQQSPGFAPITRAGSSRRGRLWSADDAGSPTAVGAGDRLHRIWQQQPESTAPDENYDEEEEPRTAGGERFEYMSSKHVEFADSRLPTGGGAMRYIPEFSDDENDEGDDGKHNTALSYSLESGTGGKLDDPPSGWSELSDINQADASAAEADDEDDTSTTRSSLDEDEDSRRLQPRYIFGYRMPLWFSLIPTVYQCTRKCSIWSLTPGLQLASIFPDRRHSRNLAYCPFFCK